MFTGLQHKQTNRRIDKIFDCQNQKYSLIDISSSYIGGLHQNGDDPLVLPVDFRNGSYT